VANYPTFPQLLGSTRETFDDLTLDRAIDGTGRGRAFFVGRQDRFVLRHVLRPADWTTLLTFYDTNRTLPITLKFDGDGATYSNVMFSRAPRPVYEGAGWIEAEVNLETL
jgi:hypothetical protein